MVTEENCELGEESITVMNKDQILDNQICVIVRFHDASKVRDLSYCLFSLFSQSYSYIQPIVVTQGFSSDELKGVEECVAEFDWDDLVRRPLVRNYVQTSPGDCRSALVNLGIASAKGRYLAFLDYDDCMYQGSYSFLIDKIRSSDAAIAFGGIIRADVTMVNSSYYTHRKFVPFKAGDVYDFFCENCYPIHSFVVDMKKVDDTLLRFDEKLSKNEDYLFLLGIVAKYGANLDGLGRVVGEYRVRTDGTNTINSEYTQGKKVQASWRNARDYVELQKKLILTTVPVSDIVELKREVVSLAGQDALNMEERALMKAQATEIVALKAEAEKSTEVFASLLSALDAKNLAESLEDGNFGYVENAVVRGDSLMVSGWVADTAKNLHCGLVVLVVGGEIVSASIPQTERPDVAAAHKISADKLGFIVQCRAMNGDAITPDMIDVLAMSENGRFGRVKPSAQANIQVQN